MVVIINECLNGLNHLGDAFGRYAVGAFLQSAVLVILLFGIDLLLRKRVRAVFRYCIWLLVLVKLVLPPTLSLPTGIGYWVPDRVPAGFVVPEHFADVDPFEAAEESFPSPSPPSSAIPPAQPAATVVEPDGPVIPAAVSLTPVTWKAILLLFWLAGMLAFAVVLAQRMRFVRGLVAAGTAAQGQLLDLLEACRRQIGVRGRVELRTSDALSSPAVCGLLRPTILMPSSLVDKLSPEGLKATLIHELAHIKRADLWVNAVQTLLQVVYFYNPFVWFANAIIRRTCEEAVDETVLVALGGQARDYSNTLIDIAEMAFWKADFGLRLVGVAESRKALQWRIKHMLTRPVPKNARIGVVGIVTILVVAAVLLPMARAERSNETIPATAPAGNTKPTDKGPATGQSDDIVDLKTGLRFTVAKRISGEGDIIDDVYRLWPSPNGRFLLYKGQVVPVDGGKSFRLEALHGTEFAAWSPDGKLIAYRDKLAIWLLPVSSDTGQPTGPARKLLDDPLNWAEREILWSRDSEWIILTGSYYGHQHTIVSARDGRLMQPVDYTRFSLHSPDGKSLAYFKPFNGIWTMPVESGPSRLAAGFQDERAPQSASVPLWWSPDGAWLLCGRGRLGSNHDDLRFVRLADHREVIFKFPEQIGYYALGVSPNGKKVRFYKTSYDSRRVYTVAPVRGGRPGELPRRYDEINPKTLASPDGQRWFFMVYRGDRGDGNGMYVPYVAAPATADPVEVKLPEEVRREDARAINYWGAERWLLSPDGKRLFRQDEYVTTRGERFSDLYVIPISLEEARSTGPATLIFKEWPGGTWSMVWSPDSSCLAIPSRLTNGRLWIVRADGGGARRLFQADVDMVDESLTWSPDGQFLAYIEESTTRVSLYTVPAEGGAAKRLWTQMGSYNVRYAWFPNSKEIGLVSDDTLVAVAVADGSVRPFLKLAEMDCTRLRWLRWSPDGQALGLYGAKDDQLGPLRVFHVSDRRIEALPDPDPAEKGRPRWTGNSRAVHYFAWRSEKVRPAGLIYEVDIEEAWKQAKASVAGESSSADASPLAKSAAPPLTNGEFRDDFEDGDTKYWTFQDEIEGRDRVREVHNGELVLENTRAILGAPEWTDYVVTVRMCVKHAGGWVSTGSSGVRFRSEPHGEYCLSAPPDRTCLWFGVRYAGTNRDRTGVLAELPDGFVLDKWYTVQMEARGSRIIVRLDGQPVIDLSDESCPRGSVSLVSGSGARVHFDDFSVRLLP